MFSYLGRVSRQVNQFFQPRLRWWLLTIGVAFVPALVSVIVVVTSQARLSDFFPDWNDEVSYWHQILTFKEVGFQGGYYTVNELPPEASFTHFYTYGPWYPMLYGSIARVIGWDFTTMLVVNSILVALAIIIFCRAVRLDGWQLMITGLMLATFWGLLFYLFTAFQEAFQQSIAILLAAVFYVSLTKLERTPRWFRWAGFFIIMAAAITRLSWAILFLPFLLLIWKKSLRQFVLALGLSIAATLIVVEISQATGAPGNNSIFRMFSNFFISFGYGLSQLLGYFYFNLQNFLNPGKEPVDIVQSIQVVSLILGAISASVLLYRHRRPARFEAMFHAYNLAAVLIASCFLYIVGSLGDYRVLATHLMITLLLLIALRRNRIVMLIVATNLIALPVFIHNYQTKDLQKFNPDHSEYEAFRAVANEYIHYDPNTANPWCNTLLFSVWDYNNDLLGVPAGIGHSFFYVPDEPLLTFKSQYILVKDADYKVITARSNAPQLELLAKMPSGSLYRNLSAGCG